MNSASSLFQNFTPSMSSKNMSDSLRALKALSNVIKNNNGEMFVFNYLLLNFHFKFHIDQGFTTDLVVSRIYYRVNNEKLVDSILFLKKNFFEIFLSYLNINKTYFIYFNCEDWCANFKHNLLNIIIWLLRISCLFLFHQTNHLKINKISFIIKSYKKVIFIKFYAKKTLLLNSWNKVFDGVEHPCVWTKEISIC